MTDSPFPPPLLESVVETLRHQDGVAELASVETTDAHSNHVAELRFRGGRTLMLKRARHDWMAPRFRTSRLACALLRAHGVEAPEHVALPEEISPDPLEAYWRVERPTLHEREREIPDTALVEVRRSWGALMRRMHAIPLSGHGPLAEADRPRSLRAFVEADLQERLAPAAASHWPAGAALTGPLAAALPRGEAPAVLVHNDLFSKNVLCRGESVETRCVGVLDLEDAYAGPPEADLAKTEILHGPLFGNPRPEGWFEPLLEGYGGAPDEALVAWFRAYQLLNMGYHAAVTGLEEHAEELAGAIRRELEALGSGRRHPQVVAG